MTESMNIIVVVSPTHIILVYKLFQFIDKIIPKTDNELLTNQLLTSYKPPKTEN